MNSQQNGTKRLSPVADLISHGVGCSGVERVLRSVRKHLGMDVAFISQFRGSDRIFESVDADATAPVYVGQTAPLQEGFCLKIVQGDLPRLMPDTSLVPKAMAIMATSAISVGSHIGVPIELDEGEIYGTLCCFSYQPDLTLGERELCMMQAFAEVLAHEFSERRAIATLELAKVFAIRGAINSGAPRIVFQPLYSLQTGSIDSVECLSRFDVAPLRSPDVWFDLAREVGLSGELELLAVQNALTALDQFPEKVSLAINMSPDVVLDGALARVLAQVDLRRIVVEITEHSIVSDYGALGAALQPFKNDGLRLAIDDAGAGYASMRHILSLNPDIIKLDMSLTRNIDSDSNRRALAKALISFARDIGSSITAEGVETQAELMMLMELGVDMAQGYYLGRPMPLAEAKQVATESSGVHAASRAVIFQHSSRSDENTMLAGTRYHLRTHKSVCTD